MPVQQSKSNNTMTLDIISPLLKNIQVSPQTSDDSWSSNFGVYTLAGEVPGKTGEVKLHCSSLSDNKAMLTLHDKRKILAGYIQQVKAQVSYSKDALCSPDQWSFSADIVDAKGKGMKNMRIVKSAAVVGDKLRVRSVSGERKYDLNGKFTINWLLFDAVRRLERNRKKKYDFTMFDHFDQIKKNQQLWYSQSVEMSVGGKETLLHAFDHVGDGIVPWVYWINESGQLLCVISGIEAYVIQGGVK